MHAKKTPLGPDVDLRLIARGTPGFSGADLANLVNEAALMAARIGRSVITMIDFENAKDKVMMGSERRSMVLTQEQKEKQLIMKLAMLSLGWLCLSVTQFTKPLLYLVVEHLEWLCPFLKLID